MKHLTILEPGRFLGLEGERLVVSAHGETIGEFPLNRLRTVQILGRGISFSSNLVSACASRGIRLFVLGFNGQAIAAMSGEHQHAVAALRRKQFSFLESEETRAIARSMVYGKIRNQRSVILYFGKHLRQESEEIASCINSLSTQLNSLAQSARSRDPGPDWRSQLMGLEGRAAALYWEGARSLDLITAKDFKREGRGARDAFNSALNLGYSILSSNVWNALSNAGLELYAGVLHTERPGKPSLVLDLMEEFRPWVVDRSVFKKRHLLGGTRELTDNAKKAIISEIYETLASRYPFGKKRMKLESIIQKQAYRLAGTFAGHKAYKPYLFKW